MKRGFLLQPWSAQTTRATLMGVKKKKKEKVNIQGCKVFTFHRSTSTLNEVYLLPSVISVSAPTK